MRYLLLIAIIIQGCSNETQPGAGALDTTVSEATGNASTGFTAQQAKNDSLIIPGTRMGNIVIGADASSLETLLGKPTLSDAAMGKAWLNWQGKTDEHNNPTEVNIFTDYKDSSMSAKEVKLVHATSSANGTEKNVHVYSSLDSISLAYPALVKTATYKHRDGRDIAIYASKAQGIAFEVVSAGEQTICIGIIIYEKGKELTDIYRLRHPQMKVEEVSQFS